MSGSVPSRRTPGFAPSPSLFPPTSVPQWAPLRPFLPAHGPQTLPFRVAFLEDSPPWSLIW